MKRKHLITVLMWCVATTLCAQTPVEKGLKSINRQAAEAYIGFLADDELQGREAGFHGSRVAARYIAFEGNGYPSVKRELLSAV